MAKMTKHELERVKKGLLERQALLTDEVREKRERTAAEGNEDASGGVGDAGDESVTRMMTDLGLEEAGRDLEELQEIDGALRRIDEGVYGICEECGREIDERRLAAQPTATRCIACQAQHEKTYAHRGTPTM
jgi:DnaK suppressor protein